MDKSSIKKYAVWARRELIERVTLRAARFGITEEGAAEKSADSIDGRLLTTTEKNQRQALLDRIRTNGYRHVMEEVAYTWFNRFAALRFMEVNGYLPSRIRVFTNDAGAFKPQILAEAIHLELDGLDKSVVYVLEQENKTEELYKYLLIVQCNALSTILPGMFQRIEDYTELLFPDNLLREGSVVEQMVTMIPEEDWTDQVQIIGWLYQYYNTEPKDKVFADLKKNIKITKENIPAATQLFTPDWIVRYMVENSLGRLWVESHPSDALKANWKYYLDEAEQEPDVQVQLDAIRKEYAALKPEEIKVIDPCMGSGHILAYLFDVLMQIYQSAGWQAREAVASIVENNLWGLDIDDRAAQLAYFAVMMKARQYDRRFFSRGIQPHVYAVPESSALPETRMERLGPERAIAETLINDFRDGKEFGSILTPQVTLAELDALRERLNQMDEMADYGSLFETVVSSEVADALRPLIDTAQALVQKYDVVVTNPPYMGGGGMNVKLAEYLKNKYPDTKSDMSTVFMERCLEYCKMTGYMTMINIPVWMFLSSYEKLRYRLLDNHTYINMVHPGRGIFGSDFGTTTFVIAKRHITGFIGSYRRLFEKQGEVETNEVREQSLLSGKGRFYAQQDNFKKIPGAPVAYWVGEHFLNAFESKSIYDFATVQEGLKTGNNDRFIRFWHEVLFSKTSMFGGNSAKWIYHTKGGDFRKWYGNQLSVLNYADDGRELRAFSGSSLTGSENYFKDNITYSRITSAKTAFRYTFKGSIPNMAGLALYPYNHIYYILGWLNTKIVCEMLNITNPTINFPPGTIGKLPITIDESSVEAVEYIAKENIAFSKSDWDSFETSWDFKKHPLLQYARWTPQQIKSEEAQGYLTMNTLQEAYEAWQKAAGDRFNQLKGNEEELNRIFIDIYGLQDELTPEVEDKDVTVRRADLQRDIKSLISYAVGCMFGRYSLDMDGLAYAGGDWDSSKYKTFLPDRDGILPICDDEYFDDDIVARFVSFIETVYGSETLEENLRFIADALGGKGSARDVIRNYFLNGFFADHCKIYQKRPIYWLFDSGKKNGFKCLIYLHRYQPDTIARIRTDYVHEQQSRYRTAIADLEQRINGASTAERVKLSKQLAKLQDQATELRVYEEKIHHLADQMIAIDLDDGVKVNYAKFQDVLAKIK